MHGFFDTFPLRQCIAALCLSACAVIAQAEVLDRIDVVTRESDAEIVVRFSSRVAYLRHVPQSNGRQVRVYFQLLDSRLPESDMARETARAPKTDRVPDVTVQYPELTNAMLVSFSRLTSYYVRPGDDGRSIILTVPLLPADGGSAPPKAAAPPPQSAGTAQAARPVEADAPPVEQAKVPPPSPEEVEATARALMYGARQALDANAPAVAINRLNRILKLPRNMQTEPAQALIGQAREQNGETEKARAEYQLYLKLFPDGPQAAQIGERLAALPIQEARLARAERALPKEAGPAEWTYFGSLSSYFYVGKSQIETLVPPPPGQLTFNRETLSAIDQRSLITSLDLNARRRDAFSDTRIVVRGTDNHNYLRPTRSYSRLYAGYLDHVDRKLGYVVRAGRQSPNGLGVLERFDGLQAGYNLSKDWRVSGVYGAAVEFNSPFDKVFYGASIDRLPQLGKPGVSVYGIEQKINGYLNRRALGTELRYFDGRATAYGMIDYDFLYHGVNIALLQANYLDEVGNSYFFTIDHRSAPSYGLTNALPGGMGLSLNEMIGAQGIDMVRRQASNLTATSDMFSAGVTRRISDAWQLGIDYRMSEISGTAPVDAVIPLSVIGTCLGIVDTVNDNCILSTGALQGSGKNHGLTFQAIGNDLWLPGAIGVSNLSFIFAPSFRGQALSLSYVLPIGTQWRLDTILRYYRQNDDSGGTQSRLSPSLRVAWQWRDRAYLEGEIGQEVWKSAYQDRQDRTDRAYLYTGLRWNLR
jgi:hypothetical protein